MSQLQNYDQSDRAALLDQAIVLFQERIRRAQDLQRRLSVDDPDSKVVAMAKAWETIGMDRLSMCHTAAGQHHAAFQAAEESQTLQTGIDPSVTAFSVFFYEHALWHDGQKEEAIQQWNAPPGVCNSPTAVCKEPFKEHTGFIRLMAEAGVNIDSYDEQGFSTLDYAALSDNPDAQETTPVILEAVRRALSNDFRKQMPAMPIEQIQSIVSDDMTTRLEQAEVRRQCRIILQEHIRPELRNKRSDMFKRPTYAKLPGKSSEGKSMFNQFHYAKYPKFMACGKLPISATGLTETGEDDFVIFNSYRWFGPSSPDNDRNDQWTRIVNAVEGFLETNPHISRQHLGLWIDHACIYQEDEAQKARGIIALPLAVTLCNTMISLIDSTYYERDWCAVEVMIIRTIIESHGLHQWWEHILDSPNTENSMGNLRSGSNFEAFDVANSKLTNDKLDRPRLEFLVRQSKLLEKDNA